MAEIQCVPSQVSVSPCPSGMAPIVTIETEDQISRYPSHFDHIATQDLIVFIALLVSLFVGFVAGKT